MRVRMWEARAAGDDEAAALVAWLFDVGIPALAAEAGFDHAEVFTGAEDRVVVLTWWAGDSVELPGPPPAWLARPAHAWDFVSVGVR